MTSTKSTPKSTSKTASKPAKTGGARSKRPANVGKSASKKNSEIIAHLKQCDPALAKVIEQVGPYKLAVDELQSTYEALAESIIYQQITGKAAFSILTKVKNNLGQSKTKTAPKEFPSAQRLLATAPEELRACGLSGSKQLALYDLARRMASGELPDIHDMHHLSDEELIEKLVTIRGIGTWTVQMMLIFRLGREDVMPHTDYGIRKGFTLAFPRAGKRAKDGLATPQTVLARAEKWKPYRTCASWYLWRSLDTKK